MTKIAVYLAMPIRTTQQCRCVRIHTPSFHGVLQNTESPKRGRRGGTSVAPLPPKGCSHCCFCRRFVESTIRLQFNQVVMFTAAVHTPSRCVFFARRLARARLELECPSRPLLRQVNGHLQGCVLRTCLCLRSAKASRFTNGILCSK